jgi:hypothetical protein
MRFTSKRQSLIFLRSMRDHDQTAAMSFLVVSRTEVIKTPRINCHPANAEKSNPKHS